MKSARILIACLCIAVCFAACKGNSSSSASDSSKINVTKDSSGTMSDSTMGNVPDSSKKSIPAPAATGPKGHVDSVIKK